MHKQVVNQEVNNHDGLRTWIELDSKTVQHNYKSLRGLMSPKTKFMAVVKSNAYGHSLVDFSKEIEKNGADWLGVDSITEASALRKAGIKVPILVLGYTLPSKLNDAADDNVSLTVSTFEGLASLAENFSPNFSGSAKKISIHIKVDTGMHRQGFMLEDLEKTVSALKKLPENISVEGLFTHFASAKNPSFPAKTLAQIDQFAIWQKAFSEAGFAPIVHACASSGAILYPQAHFDMCRFGAAMYGVWPSAQVKAFAEKNLSLLPVLTWKSIVSEVKSVPKGESVGYDFTETLKKDSVLAICPIGYWHGFPRALSSVGNVLIRGKRARVVGRVSMDMLILDATDISGVKVGDEVTIIGQDGGESITAKDHADMAETSDYEIVTRINPLIKRVVI